MTQLKKAINRRGSLLDELRVRRRMDDPDGTLRKCIFSVPPVIPARVSFRVDHYKGLVTVALINVDRLERVTLEFPSTDIEEPVFKDLVG